MSSIKRRQLGFEESSDDENISVKPNNSYKRKIKLPKLLLKSEDVDDERPSFNSGSTLSNVTKNEPIDYLNMEIVEDDNAKAQKLHSSVNMNNNHQPKSKKELTNERLRTSLFGQVSSNNDSDSSIIKELPNEQLPSKSKGLSIMEKMGFKIGDVLGKDNKSKDALLEPIITVANVNRSGLKEIQRDVNIVKGTTEQDTVDFRNRLNEKSQKSKLTKVVHRMQKYCYEFSEESVLDIKDLKPMDINVLWRGYVMYIQALLKERQVISEVAENYENEAENSGNEEHKADNDDDENPNNDNNEKDDKMGNNESDKDEELELFNELSAEEQVQRLNLHLRSEHDYCYYCATKYDDQKDLFTNCPGDSEEDHL